MTRYYKPLCLQRLLLISFLFFYFNGLVFAETSGTIVFNNKTSFTVHIVRGSGRIDIGTLAPGASLSIQNTIQSAEDYFPLFDIPLTSSFSLSRVRPGDINLYYRIDNNISYQEIDINHPVSLHDNSTYIVFTNNSRSGGISVSPNNSNNLMTGINFSEVKSNINQNETMVYTINPRDTFSLRLNPLSIRFGEMTYRNGYIYSFNFDGADITLTDIRPLHRAGEPGWVKTMDTTAPLSVVSADREIHIFASSQNGLIRHVFDSAGNSMAQIRSGDSFSPVLAAETDGNFFIAGYQIDFSRNIDIPVARIHGADGVVRRQLSPSANPEYNSAYFTTAGRKDGIWLVAGAAGQSPDHGYTAYARLVRDTGSAFAADWEIGGRTFDSELRCGEITSAFYDPVRNNWFAAGKLNERNMDGSAAGSFIAVINDNGTVQKIDTSFKGMEILKLLPDSGGNYFVIGKEQKGIESIAMAVKYNSEGRQLWRLSSPPQSNSYYQDAILDIKNGQIVLGGTTRAKDGNGNGGIPFIEGISIDNGTLLWREELTDSSFAGTSLVMSLALAPDYGFVLSLCGVAEGQITEPFMAARVNARGKLFK